MNRNERIRTDSSDNMIGDKGKNDGMFAVPRHRTINLRRSTLPMQLHPSLVELDAHLSVSIFLYLSSITA